MSESQGNESTAKCLAEETSQVSVNRSTREFTVCTLKGH